MDRLTGMRVFARVVEAGSFSAVARELGVSQPTVSKHIAALEQHLGVRLLHRSTRKLSSTEQGQHYYERCVSILADIDAVESSVGTGEAALRGLLRVTAPAAFGRTHLLPRVARFLDEHSELHVDLRLTDRYVDLVQEGIDLAFRVGRLRDSSLRARKLGVSRLVIVAAPSYLKRRGRPKAADSARHNWIKYSLLQPPTGRLMPNLLRDGNLSVDSAEAIRDAAVAGVGIAVLPRWLVANDIKAGALRAILRDSEPPALDISAVYPSNRQLSAKVRTFLDFIAAELRTSRELR